jgi:hypothetical protein
VRGSAALRAVRAAMCGSVHGSVRAVRAAVCGSSVLGSVWQCARQCAAVRQCGSMQQCTAVQQCAAVCGSAHSSVHSTYIHTKSPTIYLLVCPYTRGSGTEPVFLAC